MVTFKVVGQEKTTEQAVDLIEGLILDGVLLPGDRLASKDELAKEFGLSRQSIREACAELAACGLVLVDPDDKVFIADIISPVFSSEMIELFTRHKRATWDFLEFRADLEASAARHAAERATSADREILHKIFNAMQATHQKCNPNEESRLDTRLHMAIGEATHNIVMIQTLHSIYSLLVHGIYRNRILFHAFDDDREALFQQHAAIYQAVIDGDGQLAEQAARKHIDYMRNKLQDTSTDDWRQITAEYRLKMLHDDSGRLNGRMEQ